MRIQLVLIALIAMGVVLTSPGVDAKDIVRDAEYHILEAQNGKVWRVEEDGHDLPGRLKWFRLSE